MVESRGAAAAKSDPNGEKLFKKGKKAVTTSFWKWSADYFEGSQQFEKAAKSFAAHNLEDRAQDAWLQYSDCCEKSDDMTGAAEGLQEAAFCGNDYDKSIQLLLKADGFYKIGGYADRGLTLLKRFAKQLIDKESEVATRKAMEIYENHLMVQIF